ncbi:quinone-dependent dihydroorotate dehydrogenase [Rhodoflexus caldus]|uniref:quinone-dependent dihydroorotate dehydrogenase n=1 Tax=Rhodoflexus caldus TaxID=2891236 RepID=UPI00202A0503|nr:quinone-dependent dihydroorotate dehydrogenase [Rhodoflexus caldus]
MYRSLIRPLLFLMDAEKAHHFTFGMIKWLLSLPLAKAITRLLFAPQQKGLQKELMGLTFPNPIGLAAGFDKDARLIDELACFGFGFIEIGTLTPRPQSGNPQPRLFRLPQDSGLINRMGFNNEGVAAAVERLKKRQTNLIIGGNIGKNKDTPNEEALNDYLVCFEALYDYVDYFVINVSSPNTPGLRQLQEKEPLTALLQALQARNQQKPQPKPILLKIAPDLTEQQLDDIVAIVTATRLAGVIATNTTISREGLQTSADTLAAIGNGGLSGKPVRSRSTEVIRYLAQKSNKHFVIIGVGGIFTAEDVREKLAAGADLVQVYTGFVYEGPAMIKKICAQL